jgi:hypothetical protein
MQCTRSKLIYNTDDAGKYYYYYYSLELTAGIFLLYFQAE